MSKRALAISLLIFTALAIIGLLIWLFLTYRAAQPPAQQPAPLPSGQTPSTTSVPTSTLTNPPPAPVVIGSPAENERQAEDALQRLAMDFTARMATYSSVDEFVAMKVVYTEASAEVQAYLEAQRKQLIADHPAIGPSWGQTTRSLSSKITSRLPIIGKDTAEVTVQVQQIIESPTQPQANKTVYQEAVLSFKRQGTGWLVTHIAWQPISEL